jgi:hypothetical protein
VHAAVHKAITDVEADRQVTCTLEEYCTTVRAALQRYAMTQAAAGRPDLLARANAEVQRLDTALAGGWWPGAYGSIWERLAVWFGRRYATHFLGRRYYRRARGLSVSKSGLG